VDPDQNTDQNQSQQVAPPTEPSKKIILLIEDDPLLVRMYKDKFENEGFKVSVSDNGEEGLTLVQNERVDMIILDILMPKLSGLDFLRRLRQNGKTKDIPVIVLSNLSQREDQEKALNLGVKEYLLKANLTPSQVVEKIRFHLKTS